MIDAASLAIATQSAILLAGVWAILFWLWPAVRLDCFRQKMFEVRDELFDYASAGRIAFSNPAYRLLRQSMNGFIRYGLQVTFFQFAMTWSAWKAMEGRDSFKWRKSWEAALGSLDEQTRKDLRDFHLRSMLYVGERIVLGSPFLFLSLNISVVAVLCHMGWRSARDLMQTALSETMARSIDQRILEEEAARAAA